MLNALPKAMSAQFSDEWIVHVEEIMFRVMKAYQPGGVEEKQSLHRKMNEAVAAQNAAEALQALVNWERHPTRGLHLGVYPPDPSIQHQLIETMVSKAFEGRKHAIRLFKINQVKVQLNGDDCPTKETIQSMLLLYKAELTQIALQSGVKEAVTAGGRAPKVNALVTPQGGAQPNPNGQTKQ
jgi:hypothetical protein